MEEYKLWNVKTLLNQRLSGKRGIDKHDSSYKSSNDRQKRYIRQNMLMYNKQSKVSQDAVKTSGGEFTSKPQ